MKNNKKTWFFDKKEFNLKVQKLQYELYFLIFEILMSELKAQSVKLKWETAEKLKNLNIEIAGVELWTYDDKINHLIWFFEKYNKKHKKEIEDSLL